jgi:hypothetical protein
MWEVLATNFEKLAVRYCPTVAAFLLRIMMENPRKAR